MRGIGPNKSWRGTALAALLASATPALAQSVAEQSYNLPAQPLAASLRTVATTSGRSIIAPSHLVDGKTAPPLMGRFSVESALEALLKGSGLVVRSSGASYVIAAAAEERRPPRATGDSGTAIVVTGSRISGTPLASPVITLSEERIREEGNATLAEAVRTIPQNFGGGQNPGVGNNVPATSGVNVGSATSINLRGIGSDATLTLVNGHRLSYSASRQSIDVSSIPLGAVERIEVVPDGASAIYGSDAVAGVVNIILKRDYEGLETRARLGASTDGGHFDQRYSAVAGTRWDSGGFVTSYEFGRTTALEGRDRSYTEDRPALTLFPFLRNHSATFSGHQDLASGLEFGVDALYNHRFSDSSYASNAAGDIDLSGARFQYWADSFVIAPTLEWEPGDDWRVFLTGSYGRDHTRYDVTSIFNGMVFEALDNCYCNDAVSAELGGDGTLFDMPVRSSWRPALAIGPTISCASTGPARTRTSRPIRKATMPMASSACRWCRRSRMFRSSTTCF